MNGLAVARWDERSEPRHDVLLRTRATDADGRSHPIIVVNLSSGGLMARTDAGHVPGDLLLIDLPTMGRTAVEICWALGGRIGGRFDRPIPADRYPPLLAALLER